MLDIHYINKYRDDTLFILHNGETRTILNKDTEKPFLLEANLYFKVTIHAIVQVEKGCIAPDLCLKLYKDMRGESSTEAKMITEIGSGVKLSSGTDPEIGSGVRLSSGIGSEEKPESQDNKSILVRKYDVRFLPELPYENSFRSEGINIVIPEMAKYFFELSNFTVETFKIDEFYIAS